MAVDFLPFATDPGANVITQVAYAALPAVADGFEAGLAQSAQLNKVWRQSSFMSAVLANWIADTLTVDVLDDGDLNAMVILYNDALEALVTAVAPSPPAASEIVAGIAELATQTEANTGTDDERIMTALKTATALVGNARSFTAPQRGTITAVAYAASVTPNLGTTVDINFGDLTGDITVNNPTGGGAAQTFMWRFVQDGTGNRNWSWGTYYDFGALGLPDPNFGANAVTYVQGYVNSLGTDGIRCVVLT